MIRIQPLFCLRGRQLVDSVYTFLQMTPKLHQENVLSRSDYSKWRMEQYFCHGLSKTESHLAFLDWAFSKYSATRACWIVKSLWTCAGAIKQGSTKLIKLGDEHVICTMQAYANRKSAFSTRFQNSMVHQVESLPKRQ